MKDVYEVLGVARDASAQRGWRAWGGADTVAGSQSKLTTSSAARIRCTTMARITAVVLSKKRRSFTDGDFPADR